MRGAGRGSARALAVGAAFAGATALAAFAAAATVDVEAPEAAAWFRTDWYGIYCGDVKVGWMRRSLERADRDGAACVAREIRVVLDVTGDGAEVDSTARTVYPVSGSQALVAGMTDVVEQGRRTRRDVTRGEGRMDVVTLRRREKIEGSIAPLTVTLADELLAERLAALAASRAEGAVGASLDGVAVDLGTMAETRRTFVVTAARDAAGTTEVDVAAGTGPRGGDTFTMTAAGVLLRGSLGPQFRFALEDESKATDPAFRRDLETATRVALDGAPGDVTKLVRMTVAWDGAKSAPFPVSPRQRVRRETGRVVVEVRPHEDAGTADEAAASAALRDEPGLDLDDPNLREIAARLLTGTSSRAVQLNRLLDFTREHVADEVVLASPSAPEILAARKGDCTEHTRLFVALCRIAGIPAREVRGMALAPSGPKEGGASFGRHAWAEVALDGRWRAVDPTWGQIPADAGHIAVDPSPAAAAALLGAKFTLVGTE